MILSAELMVCNRRRITSNSEIVYLAVSGMITTGSSAGVTFTDATL
jgi:hypothetical protein